MARRQSQNLALEELDSPAANRNTLAKMSRRAYEEDGADEDWNTIADPTFDPTSAEYAHTDLPAPRGRRGRGGGGRRGRATGGMGGGRVAHPEGELVATLPDLEAW